MPKFSINAFSINYPFLNHLDMQGDKLPMFVLAKAAGADALELGAGSIEEVELLAKLFGQTQLESLVAVTGPNLYLWGWESEVEKSLNVASAFKKNLGTPMVNICPAWKPDPDREHERLEKTDEELDRQAQAYDVLIREIEILGMKACYHMHDAELVNGWREIHHLRQACPEMKFCMDVHWVYAGSGFRKEALTEFVDLVGPNIVHLHLRQSRGNEMLPYFTAEGDIDYLGLLKRLKSLGYNGVFSLEQFCFDQTLNEPVPYAMGLAQGVERMKTLVAECGW